MRLVCDPQSGLPLDSFGPVTYIPLGSLTSGSTWVGFGTTTFGGTRIWNWPFSQLRSPAGSS